MVLSGLSPWDPAGDQLLRWGANFGPLTLDNQWWRLLTSVFVHIGILHLLVNMWGLWALGRAGEFIYGPWTYVGLYLLSGLGGSVASLARNSMAVSAGASGALFGIAGALVASSIIGGGASPLRLAPQAVRSLMMVIAANLAFGAVYSRIDNGAHLGGLITGFVLGAALSQEVRWGKRLGVSATVVLFAVAGLLFAGSALYLQKTRSPQIKLALGNQALRRGDSATAIRELQQAVELRPGEASAHQALGSAYGVAGRATLARMEYERALELDSSNVALRKRLAVLNVAAGRPEVAVRLLTEAMERNPRDAQVFFELGLIKQRMGKDEEAVAQLKEAVALQPNFAPALQALGMSYLHLRKNKDAAEALQRARQFAPANPDILMALANAYERSGMTREADEVYRQAYLLRQSRKQN